MASPLNKRLEKIEQLLADRINQPLATLWREPGESHEECSIRCGYDPSQVERIRFIRWLDPSRGEVAPVISHPLDPPIEHGPPDEPVREESFTASADTPTSAKAATASQDALASFEAEERWRKAVEARAREIVQEKLDEAAAKFHRTIV